MLLLIEIISIVKLLIERISRIYLKKRVSTKTPLEYETDLVGELGNKEHINLSALGMKRSLLDASAIAHCQDWKD